MDKFDKKMKLPISSLFFIKISLRSRNKDINYIYYLLNKMSKVEFIGMFLLKFYLYFIIIRFQIIFSFQMLKNVF